MKLKPFSKDRGFIIAYFVSCLTGVPSISFFKWLLGFLGATCTALPCTIIGAAVFPFLLFILIYLIESSIMFPNAIKGFVPYNMNIKMSSFQFPKIAREYNSEIFLVGPNQNKFLNFKKSSTESFLELTKSLFSGNPKKKVKILVNDLGSEIVEQNFANLSFDKNETLEVLNSLKRINAVLEKEFGSEKIKEIVNDRRLEIRATKVFLESLCFVDEGTGHAKAYFMMALKTTHGYNRPVFYLDEHDHKELLEDYYTIYDDIFSHAEILWPVDKH
jgi:hypothetical protein